MTAANFKSGFVTIIGRPNVGKSTLMNRLIGQKIAITSNKPQTTRNRIQTVYTDMERGQIVFLDTPGIHKAKNKLGEYMVNVAEKTLNEVDVVLWLVEPSNFIGAGEQHIVEQLKKVQTPVILVINKVDTVEKDKVLEFIDTYRKIYDFAEIIPTSALRGQNVDDVIDSIFKYLPYGPQFYDEDTITDQPERAICAEIIREKALHALSDEVPHGIAVAIDQMKPRKGGKMYDIDATIVCERDSHKGIIIGKQGSMLKKIGTNARYEMEKMLDAGTLTDADIIPAVARRHVFPCWFGAALRLDGLGGLLRGLQTLTRTPPRWPEFGAPRPGAARLWCKGVHGSSGRAGGTPDMAAGHWRGAEGKGSALRRSRRRAVGRKSEPAAAVLRRKIYPDRGYRPGTGMRRDRPDP